MNSKINKSKSLHNIKINKRIGKSIYNIILNENEKVETDEQKKDRIRKMRESNPSYLLELELRN